MTRDARKALAPAKELAYHYHKNRWICGLFSYGLVVKTNATGLIGGETMKKSVGNLCICSGFTFLVITHEKGRSMNTKISTRENRNTDYGWESSVENV